MSNLRFRSVVLASAGIAACALALSCPRAHAQMGQLGIYVDAKPFAGGNTVNTTTGSPDDWINNPPTWSPSDNLWDHNEGNGGLDVNGDAGQGAGFNSIYSNDVVGAGTPQLTTTATGLDPATNYYAYVAFHGDIHGIQAAFSGEALEDFDASRAVYFTGITPPAANEILLGPLGQVAGTSSVAVDVGRWSAGPGSATFYEGLLFSEENLIPDLVEFNGTYVDAEAGVNTVRASDGANSGWFHENAPWSDHNEWVVNTGNRGLNDQGKMGSGPGFDTLYHQIPHPENPPAISTILEGLDPSLQYEIDLVYYGKSDTPSRQLSAGLEGQPLVTYDDTNGFGLGVSGDFGEILGVTLGTATPTQDGEIRVNVEFPSEASVAVYEGLVYRVVPEPSAMALLATLSWMGGLLFWRRRRG